MNRGSISPVSQIEAPLFTDEEALFKLSDNAQI